MVDNGSSDDGPYLARQAAAKELQDIEVHWLGEARAGKIHALRTGIRASNAEFVATIDADTFYPPEYVQRILEQFDLDRGTAAVFAVGGKNGRPNMVSFLQSVLFPDHCHTGGYGQAFRMADLLAVGSFDAERWPYVLEDHEIVARVGRRGRLAYCRNHWCEPSDRRSNRETVNWSWFERIAYKLTPGPFLPAFFSRFLASRFARRGLANVNLRQQPWNQDAT